MDEQHYFAHDSAFIDQPCEIGVGSKIWHSCHVMKNAQIGKNCILGQNVFVASGVIIGNNVKIQNNVSLYEGVQIQDGVFIGPHVCFTNDLRPRAVKLNGSQKSTLDWIVTPTLIREGAALGANSTIICGITIGKWAMVGAGSVVTHDVPDYGLVYGNPARLQGFVCPCGKRLELSDPVNGGYCPECKSEIPRLINSSMINLGRERTL